MHGYVWNVELQNETTESAATDNSTSTVPDWGEQYFFLPVCFLYMCITLVGMVFLNI